MSKLPFEVRFVIFAVWTVIAMLVGAGVAVWQVKKALVERGQRLLGREPHQRGDPSRLPRRGGVRTMKVNFRYVTRRWVDVTLSTDEVTQNLGLFDHKQLTVFRDELAEALADAEFHLNRIAPEEPAR